MPNNNEISHSLVILNWNGNGLTKHKNELLVTLQNNRIDITLKSDTLFANSTHFYMPDYQVFKTNHPDSTAYAGSSIVVKSSLLFFHLSQFQTDFIRVNGIQVTLNNTP
jgi:hypothetical protein